MPSPPHEIVEKETAAYRESLPPSAPDWPPDVRAVYGALLGRLFEEGLTAQAVVDELGIQSNDIYSRFKYYTDYGIKELILHHRLRLSKRLLRDTSLSVTEIAFAVGYSSPSGFCTTFKRYEDCSPTEFRQYGEKR